MNAIRHLNEVRAGRRPAAVCAALLLAASALAVDAVGATPDRPTLPTGDWNFQATLDGKPIGEHRFTVSGQGEERTVRSVAAFDVKVLGFTAYRYRHQADERWRDGCLVALKATTDDDGKRLEVNHPGTGEPLAGCVMTFAYWNPAMQRQTHLLNPQTGRYEAVQISVGPAGMVDVRGNPVEARQVRITGPKDPIELWYSPQGEWLGLDSKVGGRLLSYRLK